MIEARAARWTGLVGVFTWGGGPCAQNKPTVGGAHGYITADPSGGACGIIRGGAGQGSGSFVTSCAGC